MEATEIVYYATLDETGSAGQQNPNWVINDILVIDDSRSPNGKVVFPSKFTTTLPYEKDSWLEPEAEHVITLSIYNCDYKCFYKVGKKDGEPMVTNILPTGEFVTTSQFVYEYSRIEISVPNQVEKVTIDDITYYLGVTDYKKNGAYNGFEYTFELYNRLPELTEYKDSPLKFLYTMGEQAIQTSNDFASILSFQIGEWNLWTLFSAVGFTGYMTIAILKWLTPLG